MFKKALMIAALVAVAAPAHATCVIFPCKIKEDPIVEFVPKPPPATPSGCIYRAAASSQNLCPAGLQPVQAGGMVSCGVPVAGEICEPKVKRVKKVHKKRVVCPVGEKGCYTTH
ncbi:hypothetical protein [Cognatishimia activa]|uniref:Integral membrane protein n=1 Tax=Cognatishimia activa TaxID=1715691 RepID=A0A0P1IQG7_9RHOB|nr:hypothetical protein [Cognatishimia activa]CUJ11351.1 hypothetical protein TA5113_02323 [Cognatishimia activa]CUK25770.1 hypothetical protein TA5114_01574 [Cognatishimia activa]